ncbi:MAG: O-antigen ligase family protein [Candidatus Pacebacteria bacterium]|nr:O-antigen ligase family protein [Candidatus Paceibacterota bacterium]
MSSQKLLANALVTVCFIAIPFTSFIVLSSGTFFYLVVGKNFAFRVLVEIMLSAYLVLAVIDPVYRPRKNYLLISIVLFLVVIILAGIFGENPAKSFWSNFERMEGVVTYLHLFVYFVVASAVLTVRRMWEPYLNLHLFAGVIMGIEGVLQWMGRIQNVSGGTRIEGSLGNPAYLATYALFNIFLALFFLARSKFTTKKEQFKVFIYSAIVLLQTFVLYHTATRGGVLGLIAGVLTATILVVIFERERKFLRMVAYSILLGVIFLVGGFVALKNTDFVTQNSVLSRFSSISPTEQTTKARFMVWGMAIDGFKERPILGWGQENFNYVFNKYYNPGMYEQEQWFDRAHNVVFDWLVASGALGLLSYLGIFCLAIYIIWKRTKISITEKSVLVGLLFGYFFQNLFVFDNITSLVYFFTILGYVASLSLVEAEERYLQKASKKTQYIVSTGAVLLCCALVYGINYAGYMQNTTLYKALVDNDTNGPTAENLALFQKAIEYNSYGTSEVREQLVSTAVAGVDTNNPTQIRRQYVMLALQELDKQTIETPTNARYQLFLGNLLSYVGEADVAIKYLKTAQELSPKKQTILFALGEAYKNKNDFKNAEVAYKEAYELEPKFGSAILSYVRTLVQNKNFAEAEKIALAGIAQSENNYAMHVILGEVYANMGRLKDAIREVNRAIELNNDFKTDGEAYIEKISK